jgi:hypothetical protein
MDVERVDDELSSSPSRHQEFLAGDKTRRDRAQVVIIYACNIARHFCSVASVVSRRLTSYAYPLFLNNYGKPCGWSETVVEVILRRAMRVCGPDYCKDRAK